MALNEERKTLYKMSQKLNSSERIRSKMPEVVLKNRKDGIEKLEIAKKNKRKEERYKDADEKRKEQLDKFYGDCYESFTDTEILKELKFKGIVKDTGKPLQVSFFLKDGSSIRTIHFEDEIFYNKMGMLYHFNINKKDYHALRDYGILPFWFKYKSKRKGKEVWTNCFSKKQIEYVLEIMDDLKYLIGCKPHHFIEHKFDSKVNNYFKTMQSNWRKMAREYAVKYGIGKWEKDTFRWTLDGNIIGF